MSCDWACEGRCIPGLSPVKCQYSGGCNNLVHHICTIEWATENNIEVDSIAILCREHHPEYQAFIKSQSVETSDYDIGNTKVKPIDSVSKSSYKSSHGKMNSPHQHQGKGKHHMKSDKLGHKAGSSSFEAPSSNLNQSNHRFTKKSDESENDSKYASNQGVANCNSDDDENDNNDIFKSESFAQSLTKNLKERPAFRRNSGFVDVYVTGPFRNENTHYSHWSVVYGNLNEAWMMKASFMGGYVRTILNLCNFKLEDSLHTGSYYDFNIQSQEFGELSVWKCIKTNGKVRTINRLSFVFSIKTSEESTGLDRIQKIMKKVAWAMKSRENRPVGQDLFKHCEKVEQRIFEYFMKEYHGNEKSIIAKMTASVDAAFKNGINFRMHSHLNQFMVDYDIIRVLRDDMGYSSWSDLSVTERDFCFKNYSTTKNRKLPDWNIEEETF